MRLCGLWRIRAYVGLLQGGIQFELKKGYRIVGREEVFVGGRGLSVK